MAGNSLKALRVGMRQSGRVQALVVLFLALFVVQAATLRAHVHVGAGPSTAINIAGDLAPGGGKPVHHNEADCPLWHASGVCSAGLTPVVATLTKPPVFAAQPPLDERNTLPERFAAAWRSRAPPTL